eukprot:4680637-Pyramimonas_sp.AAC.1
MTEPTATPRGGKEREIRSLSAPWGGASGPRRPHAPAVTRCRFSSATGTPTSAIAAVTHSRMSR